MADGTGMELRAIEVGPWPMNTYALVCRETGQSVLFDPGAEPDTLAGVLEGTTPIAILLTHTHPDHVAALDEMRARLGVPVHAHPGPDRGPVSVPLTPDVPLVGGQEIMVGRQRLDVIHTPGHTQDMLSFAVRGQPEIIVGDTIFDGGPGRTWSAEAFRQSLRTLREIVLAWPDESRLYPGHGPHFRLGDRRAAIEGFLARDHGDFFGDAEWGMG